MNRTIYTETILKICRHKFVMVSLFLIALAGPILDSNKDITPMMPTVSAVDPNTVSILLGFFVVTITSCVGSLTLGGRSDYMPLIVTRPLHRFQYVVAKWLALATVIAAVTVTQAIILLFTGSFGHSGLTPLMIAAAFLDRIVAALTISSIFTFIYLLPNQSCILVGIVAFELAIGIRMVPASMVFPQSGSNADITMMELQIMGTLDWLTREIIPVLFGGSALQGFESYMSLLYQGASFLAPKVDTYDLITARPFYFTPLLEAVSNTLIALTCATAIVNAREYHYDAD
ncbi:MAG: hypothetical protein IPM23_17615 [Candidatus Melainabacteria bacterium]|nr:hypothetical protein [Candidatus Melainabacteria bacterium]